MKYLAFNIIVLAISSAAWAATYGMIQNFWVSIA